MTDLRLSTHGVDLDGTLRVLAMLPGDPTLRLSPGRLERATHTPDGPGTITAHWDNEADTVDVRTDGPGAEWLMSHAQELLGLADDDAANFEPTEGALRQLWRHHRGLRVPRTSTLWHDLCWLIVQQRIQRMDAARQWRQLVQSHGSAAPGGSELLLPPSKDRLAAIPSHEFHQLGIERRRADTLRRAARTTIDLHQLVDRPPLEATDLLETIPGIGPWTTSTLSVVTWGQPDSVIVGDGGIPSLVSWMLTKQRTSTDQQMLAVLEPFRPHRYRVVQLAFASGQRPPRRRPHPRRASIERY